MATSREATPTYGGPNLYQTLGLFLVTNALIVLHGSVRLVFFAVQPGDAHGAVNFRGFSQFPTGLQTAAAFAEISFGVYGLLVSVAGLLGDMAVVRRHIKPCLVYSIVCGWFAFFVYAVGAELYAAKRAGATVDSVCGVLAIIAYCAAMIGAQAFFATQLMQVLHGKGHIYNSSYFAKRAVYYNVLMFVVGLTCFWVGCYAAQETGLGGLVVRRGDVVRAYGGPFDDFAQDWILTHDKAVAIEVGLYVPVGGLGEDAGGDADGGSGEGGSAEGGSAEGGSAEGGSAEGGTAEGGSAEGGSAEGGSVEGGSAEGGSAEGGSAEGGSAEGGSAEGGSAEGGSAEGGSAEGGSAEGGSAEGGSAEGGSAEGGSAEGGSAEGGSAEGGSAEGAEGGSAEGAGAEGGSAEGGSAEGGSAEGGSAEGGSAEGGSAEGGSAEGGSAEGGSAEGGGFQANPDGPAVSTGVFPYLLRYPPFFVVVPALNILVGLMTVVLSLWGIQRAHCKYDAGQVFRKGSTPEWSNGSIDTYGYVSALVFLFHIGYLALAAPAYVRSVAAGVQIGALAMCLHLMPVYLDCKLSAVPDVRGLPSLDTLGGKAVVVPLACGTPKASDRAAASDVVYPSEVVSDIPMAV